MIIKTNYGLVFLTSTSELKISNPDKVLNLIHTNEMYNLFELSNNIICVRKNESKVKITQTCNLNSGIRMVLFIFIMEIFH